MSIESAPNLQKYINRIGAEQVSFDTFQVKETFGKYYTQKVSIRIKEDGQIFLKCPKRAAVDLEKYQPTDEERKMIELEVRGMKFPKAIKANASKFRELQKKLAGTKLFPFYDRKSDPKHGNIIMVQQRVDHEDGSKSYFPWSYFSHDSGKAEWLPMEPGRDTPLPFYKPENKRLPKIMIHEGAKAAHWVEMLCTSNEPEWKERREKHPWAKELMSYEHWGIIGGAMALSRANFKEIHDENPIEVVYVCDNDRPGKEAIVDVSECYGKALFCIMFDDRWPASWDLADEFPRPRSFYSASGIYHGPMIDDLLQPATYATELVSVEGTKKKTAKLKKVFQEEWIHCVSPFFFAHVRWPYKFYTEQEFNTRVAPFSDVDDTARLMKKTVAAKALGLMYDPSLPTGLQSKRGSKEGGFNLNVHRPSDIKAKKGDASKFEEFMEYLIPEENDRIEVLKWCCTLIARPDIKMSYGMLLVSTTQGVGKTTLGEHILRPLVGESNASSPSEQDIVEGGFNPWKANKRLIVANEIYAGHSSVAYNKLKSLITDPTIPVKEKFVKEYTIDNWCHMIACSNDERALKLDDQDRRWLVPRITEEIKNNSWWADFYEWLKEEEGLNIIKWWMEEFIKKNGHVKAGETAPKTTRKEELTEATRPQSQQFITDFLKHTYDQYKGRSILVIDKELVELIKIKIYDNKLTNHLETPTTIRKIATKSGGKYGQWYASRGRVHVEKGLFSHFLTNDPGLIDMSFAEAKKIAKAIRLRPSDDEHEGLQSL